MKKRTSKTSKRDTALAKLKVKVKYAPTPDVGERVSRAVDILLKSAAKEHRA
jgi:hypothetical protein